MIAVVFVASSVAAYLWKRHLQHRDQRDMERDPLVMHLGDPGDPVRVDINLKLMEYKYQDVWYYDKLFWHVAAWVTTVGVLLLSPLGRGNPGADPNALPLFPGVMVVYGLFAFLSGYFLSRLLGHRIRSVLALRRVAEWLGDHSNTEPAARTNRGRSAAVWYMTFVDCLGIGTFLYGVWLWTR